MVICKSTHQRPLLGVKSYPVTDCAQHNSEMTQNIFEDRPDHSIVPDLKKHFGQKGFPEDSKTVLMVDNMLGHVLR